MKKIFILTIISVITLSFTSCDEDVLGASDHNFFSFEDSRNGVEVAIAVGEELTQEVMVYSNRVSSSDRTVNVVVDTDLTTMSDDSYILGSSTVTIPANTNVGVLSVSFLNILDEDDDKVLVLSIVQEGSVLAGEDLSMQIGIVCPYNSIELNITTDDWPDETSWELYNLDSGQVLISSGGPYVNPDDDFATITTAFCLEDGSYGVIVYDAYGDGISGGGFDITLDGVVIASGTVPGGTAPSFGSAVFTLD